MSGQNGSGAGAEVGVLAEGSPVGDPGLREGFRPRGISALKASDPRMDAGGRGLAGAGARRTEPTAAPLPPYGPFHPAHPGRPVPQPLDEAGGGCHVPFALKDASDVSTARSAGKNVHGLARA